MQLLKVKTRALLPPLDNLYSVLDDLPKLREGDVLLISSKVLAIHQGRCVPMRVDKQKLIKQEAEKVFANKRYPGLPLAVKENTLIAAAGIDESNGNGYYVLWPKGVNKLLKEFCLYLKKKHKIEKLALIATDSYLIPMRAGTVGISMGFYGLEPLRDYRKKKDIFGQKLQYTQSNVPDALAAFAALHMGEGDERTPMVILRDVEVAFTTKQKPLAMNPSEDLYEPLLRRTRS